MTQPNPYSCWQAKPWWCQPWSILLTGVVILSASWGLFRSLWVTLGVAIPILVWWTYFLVLWPLLLQQAQGSGSPSRSSSETPRS